MATDPEGDLLRVTVDEINADQDNVLLATLVSSSGGSMAVPLSSLPEGTREGDVLTVRFERDQDERERRRKHIADLQRRLFGND